MDTKEEDILATPHLPTFKWTLTSFLYETIARKKLTYKVFCFCRHMTNTKLLKGNRLLDMTESITIHT